MVNLKSVVEKYPWANNQKLSSSFDKKYEVSDPIQPSGVCKE